MRDGVGVDRVGQSEPRVVREPWIADTVLLVDGLPGCGKTLLSTIVGSLDRVEAQRYEYALEYVCSLHFLGHLSADGAASFIKILTDLGIYNMMMSREANFRWTDLSGVLRNPRPLRYLRRLLLPDGEPVVTRIRQERPILNLVTHQVLAMSDPVFAALGDRVRFIEVVRHPLYMIKQWHLYIDRYGTDPRDFTIWIDGGTVAAPWWAKAWPERYARMNAMDRVIYSIEALLRLVDGALDRLGFRAAQVLVLPFERFVIDPWPYLRRMESLLGTSTGAATRRVLKQQNVPRRMFAEGIPLKTYRQYGWEPPRSGATEEAEFDRRRAYAVQYASAEGMATLDRLCVEYEARFMRPDDSGAGNGEGP